MDTPLPAAQPSPGRFAWPWQGEASAAIGVEVFCVEFAFEVSPDAGALARARLAFLVGSKIFHVLG